MATISIPLTYTQDHVTYYEIVIQLPLRKLTVAKRYSDFVTLVSQLCQKLGIDASEFPYALPPKNRPFIGKQQKSLERKNGLQEFLDNVIRDRDLQNRPLLHEFLLVPKGFKFSPDLFQSGSGTTSLGSKHRVTAKSSTDSEEWLTMLRHVRASMEELRGKETKVIRDHLHNYVEPNIETLLAGVDDLLKRSAIDNKEAVRRHAWLKEIRDAAKHTENVPDLSGSITRVTQSTPAQETPQTRVLGNQELLQAQLQIQKDQDKELESLRKIIARQREMGESISREVEEQIEILERLDNEVADSGEKIDRARNKTHKFQQLLSACILM